MPETKTNRLEMQKCLEELENKEYWRNDGKTDLPLVFDLAFIALKKIANQEVHPSGDQSLLSNQSIYSWERLISMRDEAHNLKHYEPDIEMQAALGFVQRTIEKELQRRLLALLPQEK